MGSEDVSVLIVDDQVRFRRAAAAVVKVTGGFEVVGEAESGEEAVQLAGSLAPQLVLMDINMGGISGIEATRRIKSGWPEVAVVLLSTYQAEDLPADVGSSGALAYVHKEDFGPRVLEDVWAQRDGGPLAM